MKSFTEIGIIAAMAAVATLLGGCEKESNNIVENGPIAARITSTIDAMETRAAGTAWTAGDAIGVSGMSAGVPYTNIQYATTTGNGTFTVAGSADNTIYFLDNNPVNFTAYYPYTGSNGTAPGIISHTIKAEDQAPATQPTIDYLFASASGSAAAPNVQFRFKHYMSRIVFNFQAGDGITSFEALEYTLSGVILSGTFDTATGEAKASGTTPADLSMQVPYNATGMSSALILFPQQSDAVKTLTLTMRGTTYNATFQFPENAENGNVRELASGYSYIYNVKLNNATMTISPATIGPWGDGGSEDINSTN